MAKHAKPTYETYAQMNKPKGRVKRFFGRLFGTILALAIFALVGFGVLLVLTEYNPAEKEALNAQGGAKTELAADQEFTILTWNIGFASLGDNTDFFMDGGSSIVTSTEDRVKRNVDTIVSELQRAEPDITLIQEIDQDSGRSHHVDQVQALLKNMPNMVSYYATNYRVAFIPLGIPPIGHVESGLQTLSTFNVSSAERIALANGFSWPMRLVQLKRCLLVTRIPVADSDHELVLVNIHPDAYADEGQHAAQLAQTRDFLLAEAAAGNWVIAGGDWNSAFPTIDASKYPLLDESYWKAESIDAASFGEGWQFVMDDTAPTCRLLNKPLIDKDGQKHHDEAQYYVLDGFIASSNVEISSVETQDLDFVASDHNPVVAKVLLKKD